VTGWKKLLIDCLSDYLKMTDLQQWVSEWIRREEQTFYALTDQDLRMVQSTSSGIWTEITGPDLRGRSLTEVFPELIGVEDHLAQLAQASGETFRLPKIQRLSQDGEEMFFDLYIKAAPPDSDKLLMAAIDVTTDARLEQALIHQRNELRLNIEARQQAEAALQKAKDELEIRVADRTAELQEANQRLKALSRRLVEIQEAERRQIARELHDEVGQALTGLNILLGMSARAPGAADKVNLLDAQTMVQNLMTTVRQLSLDLRPAILDDLGLVPALLWLFDRYTTQTGVEVDFKHADVEARFATEIETAAYRIVQEALTNTARYADVTTAQVRLWTDQDKLWIRVEDQGKGFDPEAALAAGTSSGLSGMLERAALLGGDLEIYSAPREGTQITASLPLVTREHE
jgi:signal transduction histidine kinase